MTFPILGGNGAVGGYAIDNSLRFNDNDSPYMIWTPSSSGDNTYIWTFSTWIKRCTTASTAVGYDSIFSCYDGSNYSINIAIGNGAFSGTGDYFEITYVNSSYAVQWGVRTNALLRDNSAWYNLQIKFDTTQATANNRITLYVNGEEASVTRTNSPSQNTAYLFNTTTAHNFGRYAKDSNSWFDGYFAETHFIDGQALSPTDFGEFDEDSGIWKPIQYTGTYGTNGFYLDFENSGSLGADQSGNGNNFTPTNLASTDQTTDTPTNNFATMNPLAVTLAGTATFSEGNCQVATVVVGSMGGYCNINFPSSGKWYCEAKITTSSPSNAYIGVVEYSATDSNSFTNGDSTFYYGNGDKYVNGSTSSYGSAWSQNDIIGMAVNVDDNQITFYLNGVSQGVLSETIEGKTWNAGDTSGGVSHTFQWNFGNPVHSISSGNSDGNGYGNFEYAPPSGYLALCTQNLATELSPTIDDGSEYFNTVLYTGNASDRTISGVGFQPDWVWIKNRSASFNHGLFDSNRGATLRLSSSTTGSEVTYTESLTAFNSDGFDLGDNSDGNNTVNNNSENYVAWNWKAFGGSTSSNTSGSITSTVQANTTAGFSIVTYTGNGIAGATFGHGLGVVPDLIIVKRRDSSSRWNVWTPSLTNNQALYLDGTEATQSSTTFWNDTTPTSSVITLGTDRNVNGGTYVCYAFKNIEGYSSLGKTYTGNGSTDGTFIYTGFRPAFVIVKRTDIAKNWYMFDSVRNTFNVIDDLLAPNLSDAESSGTGTYIDFLSNGFKLRQDFSHTNASGSTQIYMCFSANPFVTSSGVPVTAR